MKRFEIARILIACTAVAALSFGCALFGGGDKDDEDSMSGGFDSGSSERGMGGDGGGGGQKVAELENVYFDYDRAVIRDNQKPTLRTNSGAIGNHSEWRTVVIEGHTDERGSEEYNLALGERRANATKSYLVNLGVSGGRLDTVSFGESKPSVQGHDESAWKWNRRAEFRVIR